MPKLHVAGAQIPVVDNIAENLEALERAIDFAAAEHADVLLTPEGSLSGYTHEFDRGAAEEGLVHITEKARGCGVGLAVGTCFFETGERRPFNQVRVYDKKGEFLGFHSKILRCTGERPHYGETPLRTFQLNGITVGCLICNDMWANPSCTPIPDSHLTRQLAGMGAQLILHAVNGGRGEDPFRKVIWSYHESNLRMRAHADKLWIVTVDNCHPAHWPCAAPCGVVDPEGNWAMKTQSQGEQLFAYTIDV